MPLHSDYSKLTPKQTEAIGRVAINWSIVEFAIEGILARLARAPGFLSLALTNNLSMDNRLIAIRDLVEVHGGRYCPPVLPLDVLAKINEMRSEIAHLKDRRNAHVHAVWFRSTDEQMFGTRFKGRLPTGKRTEPYQIETTLTEVRKFVAEIETLSDRLLDLLYQLPEIDEASLGKSP